MEGNMGAGGGNASRGGNTSVPTRGSSHEGQGQGLGQGLGACQDDDDCPSNSNSNSNSYHLVEREMSAWRLLMFCQYQAGRNNKKQEPSLIK